MYLTETPAARLLLHCAAVKPDRGEHATGARSIAGRLAGDSAVARKAGAVQVFGDSGHIRGFEVERLCRDAALTQNCEGTNRIRPMIIALEFLGNGAAS